MSATESNPSKNLAQNLISLRKSRVWSQSQLAQAAGIPRTTIAHIESGSGNPSLANLAKLSASLQVGLEELLVQPRAQVLLVASEEVPAERRSRGQVILYKLLPERLRGVEIDRMEFEPLAAMAGTPHVLGTHEYFHCIVGEVEVFVSGERHRVRQGDVLAFPADQPHSYRNILNKHSSGFSVVLPFAGRG